MKELIKPDRVEARYETLEAFSADRGCVVDRSCERRNRCESQNSADAEVMDEILF